MGTEYTIPLSQIEKEFSLERITVPENYESVLISTPDIWRPGLSLAGFYGVFDRERISIIGTAEHAYLSGLQVEDRKNKLVDFVEHLPAAIIFTRELPVFPELIEKARELGVPVFTTKEKTSAFNAALISSLNTHLAPRLTRHGVLVEVYGEGILLVGDSGVGKSETAIELVKRGHRLIADDAVELRRVSDKAIVGSAPEMIRHYIELRGIGIVDVKRVFGIGAVKDTEKVNMVLNLEPWEQGKVYDRMGLETEYTDIMGLQIPSHTIPVHPGRNLAVIIEIAAINNRQKRMGHNSAKEFNERLLANIGITDPEEVAKLSYVAGEPPLA